MNHLANRKRLALAAAVLALAFALVPALAFAAPSAAESQDQANSWRFQDGRALHRDTLQKDASSGALLMPQARAYSWQPSYGKSKFAYNGVTYKTSSVCSGVKSIGIDVSEHNGSIDWKKVKASGVTYAIIRCGYGGNYASQDDYRWLANIKGARAAGVKCGVYLYSYAYNTTMAKSEANHVLRCLKEAGITPGKLGLPVYYDLEETRNGKAYTQGHSISKAMLGEMATTFCNKLSKEGYKVGIYANTYWWTNLLTAKAFSNAKWSKWVAQYYKQNTYAATKSYGKYMDIWQFTSTGKVDGISGADVDVNFLFKFPAGYKISYKLDGGVNNAANPATYTGKKTIKLYAPYKRGYSFKGWYSKSTFKSKYRVRYIKKKSKGKKTLYARYKVKTYEISYQLNGGTQAEGQRVHYKVTSAPFSLKAPTREGYVFEGWYTTPTFDEDKLVTEFATGSAGNKTLYAKWGLPPDPDSGEDPDDSAESPDPEDPEGPTD